MQGESRTVNTIRNAFWGIVLKLLVMVSAFVFRAIIIREIGAVYVGLSGIFRSILNILNMAELGFGSAITYMMYKPVADNNVTEIRALLNTIKTLYNYVGLIILLIGFALFPFLNDFVQNDTGVVVNIYVLYSMYIFNSAFSYLSSAYRSTIFTAYQRNDIISKITTVVLCLQYIIQATVLYFTKNYYFYVLVFSLSVIPQNLLYYFYSRRMYPHLYCEGKISPDKKATIKSKIAPLLAHRIGGIVIVSIDDLIISVFLGVLAVTQYDNYFYIFHALSSLLMVLRGSIVASLGNKLFSSSREALYKTYKKVFFVWVMVVGWFTCCLIGLYQPFMRIWVGEKFVYNDTIMLCICIYFFVWQFRFIGVTMKEAAGLWEPDRLKPIIGIILKLFLSIFFVKLTGSVLGFLVPTIAIMILVYFPWETYILFKFIFKDGLEDYISLVCRCCATVCFAGFVIYFITRYIPSIGIDYIIFRLIICIILPLIVFTVFLFNTEEYQSTVKDIKRVFLKRED